MFFFFIYVFFFFFSSYNLNGLFLVMIATRRVVARLQCLLYKWFFINMIVVVVTTQGRILFIITYYNIS